MPTPIAGDNEWQNEVREPADGDAAIGASFIGVRDLADRTTFLQLNYQPAIANHRSVKTTVLIDRFSRACYGAGAGPFNYGLFAAVGRRSGGGAGISLSPDGEQWFDYAFELIGGLVEVDFRGIAHGGDGAPGSRVFAVCGHLDDSGTDRPVIMTAPDDAEANANPLIPEILSGHFTSPAGHAAALGSLTGSLRSICWNGTVFCAVGNNGLIVTLSADLATETVRTPGASYADDFYHVFANGSDLIATGENGEIQRSQNHGVTWTREHSDPDLGTISSGVPLVVGTSDGNKILRSTNGGNTWSEVEIIPEAAFDGSQVLVFELGEILGAILRNENTDSISIAAYSFDRGATWPLVGKPMSCYGTHIDGTATNGQRTILVGGSPDGTSLAHIFATALIMVAQ